MATSRMARAQRQVSAFDSPAWISTLLHHKKMLNSVCAQHFQEFDTDSNNQLDEGELRNLCNAIATAMHVQEPDAENLHAAFLKFDRSNSGGLTATEFSRFFEHFLRASLPLMVTAEGPSGVTPAPRKGLSVVASVAHQEKQSPSTVALGAVSKGGYTSALSSASPEAHSLGITLSVHALSGELVWGPGAIPCATVVAYFRDTVAEAKQIPHLAILLIQGDSVLALHKTMTESGVQDGAELMATIASPECLVETALKALAECPIKVGHAKESQGKVGTVGWIQEPWTLEASYRAWAAGGAGVVRDQIELLAQAVQRFPCYRKVVEDLVLNILDINISDQFLLDGDTGIGEEMYPDHLTWAAAHSLALVAEPSNKLNCIFMNWISRASCGRTFFYNLRTQSLWTLDEMLRMCPQLVDRAADAKCNVKGIAKALAHTFSQILKGDTDKGQWQWADACYWTYMEIGVHSHSSKSNLNSAPCVEYLKKYNMTAHLQVEGSEDDEDEEWMEQYMYVRP